MIPFFPKTISKKGLLLYFVSLTVVSVAFLSFAMDLIWILLGILEVSIFFLLSSQLSREWQKNPSKLFEGQMFGVAMLLRVIWVIFSYYFYLYQTGQPFEFGAADSWAYHEDAKWLAGEPWSTTWDYLFISRTGVSDSGYCLYLTIVYKIFGPSIIFARLLKAVCSSLTCIILYRLTRRIANEQVGRMTGIFAMLMPNLILYCGLHLKETEMLLLIVSFLERTDYTLRSKKLDVKNLIFSLALAGSLFFFRTVLGAVAVFALISAVVFSPSQIITKRRKVVVGLWIVLTVLTLAGGTVWNEVEGYWNNRGYNQDIKREQQMIRGNLWAKYATGGVMAPMVFVMPFSTMVDTGQENQMVMHGGNFVRNFMGIFALITLFSALFLKKNWRDFSLIGAFAFGYLGVISLSGFANSERFLLPGLPCLIILWAYGISILNAKSFKFVKYWYAIVVVMEIAWAYFKIGSRGMLG